MGEALKVFLLRVVYESKKPMRIVHPMLHGYAPSGTPILRREELGHWHLFAINTFGNTTSEIYFPCVPG